MEPASLLVPGYTGVAAVTFRPGCSWPMALFQTSIRQGRQADPPLPSLKLYVLSIPVVLFTKTDRRAGWAMEQGGACVCDGFPPSSRPEP